MSRKRSKVCLNKEIRVDGFSVVEHIAVVRG